MTDKVKATLPETVEEAEQPVSSEKLKRTQTTVEGAGEIMIPAGSEARRSEK